MSQKNTFQLLSNTKPKYIINDSPVQIEQEVDEVPIINEDSKKYLIVVLAVMIIIIVLFLWVIRTNIIVGAVYYYSWCKVANCQNLFPSAAKSERKLIAETFGTSSSFQACNNLTRGQLLKNLSKIPLSNSPKANVFHFTSHGWTHKGEAIIGVRRGKPVHLTTILRKIRNRTTSPLVIVLQTCMKGKLDTTLYSEFRDVKFICAAKDASTVQRPDGSVFTIEYLKQLNKLKKSVFTTMDLQTAAHSIPGSYVWN